MSQHNGHTFSKMVDSKHRRHRIDKRLSKNHKGCRTNMRDREGKRSKLLPGEVLSGTKYDEQMTCMGCFDTYSRDLFQNKSVLSTIRHNNGMNIRCRYCIDKLKTNGYKLNAFIAKNEAEEQEISDEEEDSDEDSDEDDELEEDELEEDEDDLEDDYFNVEKILNHKLTKKAGKLSLQLLVKCEGYSSKHNTWEPYDNLKYTMAFKNYNLNHQLIDDDDIKV